MKKKRSCLPAFLKIGCVGFGGGTALIPILEGEMVQKRKAISKEDFDEAVLVAGITPGALPVEISGCIGKKAAGLSGMFLAAMCMALPGVVLTVLMMAGMDHMPEGVIRQIELISVGITAFILSMLTKYIIETFAWANRKKRTVIAALIAVGVFMMKGIWNVSTVWIILIALAGLLVVSFHQERSGTHERKQKVKSVKKPGVLLKEEAAWLAFLLVCSLPAVILVSDSVMFMLRGILSSLLSFGGGDAYLTVAESLFVDSGLITQEAFYGRLVTIVNVLPGSILCKTLSGIGYYLGYHSGGIAPGILTALAGFACSVVGSGAVVSFAQYFLGQFKQVRAFQMLKSWIKVIISGLLGTVMLSLIRQCIRIAETYRYDEKYVLTVLVVLCVANLIMEKKTKVSTWICALSSGILAWGIGNLII